MGDKQPINAKKKQVIEQQNYFSEDFIIQEILTRLPVKSVLRFKSVSKQWYSTLSSSGFTNAHLLKSLFSHRSAPVETLFIKNCQSYYLFSYDDDDDGDQDSDNFEDNLVKLDVKDYGVQNYNAEFTGSCNGLICLTIFSNKCFIEPEKYLNPYESYFIIWNPATQKLHRYESDGYAKRNIVDYCHIVARGFGYASSVDDYKYVRILSRVCICKESPSIVHIFSLRKNKWRKIDFVFDHDKVIPRGRAMLIDEKLYWKAVSITQRCIVILSFDLEVEQFEIIQFNVKIFDSVIGVMGGCWSKWEYGRTNGAEKLMHILESPTSMKSICLPKELLLDDWSQMIGFTRTGKIFVTGTLRSDDEVIRYNPSDCRITLQLLDIGRKPMQNSILMNFNGLVDIAKYVPSLASPFPIEELSKT